MVSSIVVDDLGKTARRSEAHSEVQRDLGVLMPRSGDYGCVSPHQLAVEQPRFGLRLFERGPRTSASMSREAWISFARSAIDPPLHPVSGCPRHATHEVEMHTMPDQPIGTLASHQVADHDAVDRRCGWACLWVAAFAL